MTKDEAVKRIRCQITTTDRWALRALEVVYANQTTTEQNNAQVIEHNEKGFTPIDAEFLTSLARQYERRGTLSDKQCFYLRKKMGKYAGQVFRSAVETGKLVKLSTRSYIIAKSSKEQTI